MTDDLDLCLSLFEDERYHRVCDRIADAIRAGQISIDHDALAAWWAEQQQVDCGPGGEAGDILDALIGHVAEGRPCPVVGSCVEGTICTDVPADDGVDVCAPLGAEGQPCRSNTCAEGLDCGSDRICVADAPPPVGSPCPGGRCAPGAYCECFASSGLGCDERRCVPYRVEGEPCGAADDGAECWPTWFCSAAGVCAARSGLGAPCEDQPLDSGPRDNDACVDGYVCLSAGDGSGAGTCVPPVEPGGACFQDADCGSDVCECPERDGRICITPGRCVELAAIGEPCAGTRCAAGLVCSANVCVEPEATDE